jgi:hypothetical protein
LRAALPELLGGLGVVLVLFVLNRSRLSLRDLKRRISGRWGRATRGYFKVVIADLEHDEGLNRTKLLAEIVGRNAGLRVHLLGQRLAMADAGSLTEIRSKLQRQASAHTARLKADLLIFGRVVHEHVLLYFAAHENPIDEPRLYDTAPDQLRIISDDLDVQLHAVVLSHIEPTTHKGKLELQGLLEAVTPKLTNLVASIEDPKTARQVLLTYGNVAYKLGMLGSGISRFKDSIHAYEKLLSTSDDPAFTAEVQRRLGECLADMGDAQTDVDTIREGIEHFKGALEFYTYESDPITWGTVTLLFAYAEYSIGQFTGDLAVLSRAESLARSVAERY